MRARHPVKNAGGKASHVQAFEKIAIGERPRSQQITLDWLENHGLIEKQSRIVGQDRFGAIEVTEYDVPMWAHMEWCEWGERELQNRNLRERPVKHAKNLAEADTRIAELEEALALAIPVVSELVNMYSEARADGRDCIVSMVGSKFEKRVDEAWAKCGKFYLELDT